MNTKTCNKCGLEKDKSCFGKTTRKYKDKVYKYLKTRCEDCEKEYRLNYRQKEKDRCTQLNKKWNALNKEKSKAYQKEWAKNNKDRVKEHSKKHRSTPEFKRKEQIRQREARENNPLAKFKHNIRTRIRHGLRGFIKSLTSETILGCSWADAKAHIESQFKEGMTWENYGFYGWHADHIVPLASAKTQEEVEALCHYTNLQPLWWYDNLSKGAKMPTDLKSTTYENDGGADS